MGGLPIHLIDLFTFLHDEIVSVQAESFRQIPGLPLDDTVNLTLRFSNGTPGHITTMMATPWTWRVQVFGTEAWVLMTDDDRLEVQRIGKSNDRYINRPNETLCFDKVDTEQLELEAFASAIRGDADFPISAKEIISDTRILDEAITQTSDAFSIGQ